MVKQGRSSSGNGKVWFCFALFLLVFTARELDYIRRSSQTYDEHFYIAYGSSLLHTWDFRLRKDKTSFVPLVSALPLLFTKTSWPENDSDWLQSDTRELPQGGQWAVADDKGHVWQFALNFLYKNSVPPDTILFLARLPILLLSFILAFFVFKWARELYGDVPALIALGLYTWCPNILAHSGLVTEDIALSLFVFLTVYFFWKYHATRLWRHLALSGAAMGFALNTKYSALILLPVMACLAVFEELAVGKNKFTASLRRAAAAAAVAAAVLLLFYGIVDVREYVMGFRYTAEYIKRGQMTFLAGNYSPSGFWNYFLYAFFLKTPLPVIIASGLAVVFKYSGFNNLLKYREGPYLLIVPIALFLAASFSPLQIGLRHILPIYPFLFVLCGGTYTIMKEKFRWVLAALGLWYLGSSAAVHPHYLAYFNELAGGPAGGYEYLLDSNLDWGQDLKGLKRYVRESDVSDVVLSYFGSSVPEYFGRDFQDLFSFGIWGGKAHVNSLKPAKEILAISVTNLQGLYLSRMGVNTFFWLKEKRPKEVIGDTIYVYDVTGDAAAHERLANIYFISGQNAQAARECERALILEPGAPAAVFISALNRLSAKGTEALAMKTMGELLSDDVRYNSALEELAELADTSYARNVYSARLLDMGLKMLRSNEPRQAERLLRLALTMDRENLYAYINLSVIYLRNSGYKQALEICSDAEELGLKHAELFYNKALAFYYLKDPGNARLYLRKTLEQDPAMPQAKKLLSSLP
jgi:tetratricopeptide (TPR) repeat protein